MQVPIPCFYFYFLFRSNDIKEQLDENNFRRCYGKLFSKVSFRKYLMLDVLSQQLQDNLTKAFERHPLIEDFIDMYQHRCRACTKIYDILLYASLSLKQT